MSSIKLNQTVPERQTSEDDCDIDNLLASLTAAEMEELENEFTDIDPDPTVPVGLRQRNQTEKQPLFKYNRGAMLDFCERETRQLIQRELSFEGELRRGRGKRSNLKKMGKSCESFFSMSDEQDDLDFDCSAGDSKKQNRPKDTEGKPDSNELKDVGIGQGVNKERSPHNRFRKDERKKDEIVEKNREGQVEVKEECIKKEKSNCKPLDLISKLQSKKDNKSEKDKKEDCRKKTDKTRELISKMQREKEVKEKDRKEIPQKLKGSKIRGMFSKEKDRETDGKGTATKEQRDGQKGDERENTDLYRKQSSLQRETEKVREETTEKILSKSCKSNQVEQESSSDSKENPSGEEVTEEAEEDVSSMFDELLDRVRKDDPTLTELNVNNSDVIKTQTLIQFAEALLDNKHVKTFALANTRADDHVAYAVAHTLRSNTCLTSINLDSNHLTGKGILALIYTLPNNTAVTELRFHNQRHICGGKTEMEMTKTLRDNSTLLKLGYHFELAGPRMTMTNILSRNMDQQRQRRMQEKKEAEQRQETPSCEKTQSSQQAKPSGKATQKIHSDMEQKKKSTLPLTKEKGKTVPNVPPVEPSLRLPHKLTAEAGGGRPVPPPPPPPAPVLDGLSLRKALTPVAQRKQNGQTSPHGRGRNSRDQLLASIRNSTMTVLKKVDVPKLLH